MVHKIRAARKRAKLWATPILLGATGIFLFLLGITNRNAKTATLGLAFILLGTINIKIAWKKAHLPTSGPKDEEEFEHEEK